MSGIRVASTKPLDGKSVKPLLLEQSKDWPDRMIFSLQGDKVSVRTQQYRLDPQGQLFDIPADPGQDRNIAKEKPEVAARLRQAVAEWSKEMLPLVGEDDRPFPVGYSETTMLPARDGVPEGGIERSAGPPNCSFFTNWKKKEDRMTWDIEVGRDGEYEAVVYYTCRPEDVGSAIELSFLDRRIQGRLTKANNPPLIGAEADRVPRNESYVKDFLPWSLGKIQLAKSRGKLVLKATEIPGKQVADVRYIALKA
jgi:hypothetical protein